MDKSQIEIDDLLIGQAISEDSFGIFYSAHHQQLNKACLIYGLVSLPERPITKARLAQSLGHTKLIDHPSLAQVITFQECDQVHGQELLQLAMEQGVSTSPRSPIEFLVVYQLNPIGNLANHHGLTEPQIMKMGEDLLELLSHLHKKRAYHHALSPKTLWLSDEGIKLTHSGLYSIYKRRGLSLKSSPNPDLDPALTHRQVYASPEELMGKLSTQGSDLFSVAAILYECLIEPLAEPVIDAGEYKRTFRSDLPEIWQKFFHKSMATHIRDRFPTAEQMLKAFKTLPTLNMEKKAEHLQHATDTNSVVSDTNSVVSDTNLVVTDVIASELITELEQSNASAKQLSEADLIDTVAVDPQLIAKEVGLEVHTPQLAGSDSSSKSVVNLDLADKEDQPQNRAQQLSMADLIETVALNPEFVAEQEKQIKQSQHFTETALEETVALNPELVAEQEKEIKQSQHFTETALEETVAPPPELVTELDKKESQDPKLTEAELIATVAVSPNLLPTLEENNEDFDQTHSELDQGDHSQFDLDGQTELSEPNLELDNEANVDEQSFHESANDTEDKTESQMNQSSDSAPVSGESKVTNTVGFFSGGEVSSEGFKSLRSQLSPSPSVKSVEASSNTSKVDQSDSYDDMAFGLGSDLGVEDDFGFGFGFGQKQQDERTFIEFSDVDDQTIFEADQDQIVQESYKTELGLMVPGTLPKSQTQPSQVQSRQAKTMAFFSQGNNDFDVQDQLQTPDFLNDLGDEDPSRILPIPKASKTESMSSQKVGGSQFDAPPPLAQVAMSNNVEKPAALIETRSSEPVHNSLGIQKSSIMGNAQDWPGQSEAQVLYTPPTPTGVVNRDSRPVAKVRKGQSFLRRLATLIIPLVLVSLGAIGVYWTHSNLDLVMSMLASEAPERLSISTYPNDMQVVINNKPVQDRSPLIYNFKEAYSSNHKLPIRFMWKRKIHNEQINLSNGTTSVYFLAETMKKSARKYRYRRKSSNKTVKFSKAYIETPGESLQVLLKDQPIGQTPLWVIAEQGKELYLKLIGPGIEKEIKVTPDNTLKSQVSIPMTPKND